MMTEYDKNRERVLSVLQTLPKTTPTQEANKKRSYSSIFYTYIADENDRYIPLPPVPPQAERCF